MKTPQPVAYATGQPKALRRALGGLLLLLLGVSLWWSAQTLFNPAGQVWRVALVLCSCVLSIGALRQHLRQDPRGLLRFDGERWWYQPQATGQAFSEQPVLVELIWDAQTLLLLRMRWDFPLDQTQSAAPHTLWLHGDLLSHEWVALRRALMATARNIKDYAITV